MKKLIILFIIFYSLALVAQRPSFSIGLTYQPTFYWSYNKSDRNKPRSFPVGPNGFNGQAIGLEVERYLSKSYSLMMEITYADQIQKFTSSTLSVLGAEENVKVYNTKISTQFKYLKIPLLLTRFKKVKKLFLFAYLGPQLSVLMDYERSQISYNITNTNPSELLYDDPIIMLNFTPYEFIGDSKSRFDPRDLENQKYTTDFLFNRYVLGVVGGFGFKKVFKEHFYIDLKSRFEFDFSDSEAKYFKDWMYIGGHVDKEIRGVSHNIRIGFSISAGYIFSVEKEEKLKM